MYELMFAAFSEASKEASNMTSTTEPPDFSEAEQRDRAREQDEWLDAALELTFPASDPLPSFRFDDAPFKAKEQRR
jgi:hypothetical protein